MDSLLTYFGVYEIKARFFPALLILLPFLFTLLIWYPELIEFETSIIILIASIILLFFIAKISREAGLKVQAKLLNNWGGFPTTIFLRHRDSSIDYVTKERYHTFLSERISNIQIPSAAEENENPDLYDLHYGSAVKWLLENTRDPMNYSMIHQDNSNYGFSRNMLGVKLVGILISFISLLLNIYGAYDQYKFVISEFPLKIWIAFLVSILFILLWVFFVNSNWVKSTSRAYARSLLATCESRSL